MRTLNSILLSIVVFSLGFLWSCNTANQSETSYFNPVIPGEIPDPSIIRVVETYYAAGTSFDFAPIYPVYQSSDLVNWKRIGSVFNEPPDWSSDDFWAPELFFRDGTFYVYYTTKRKDNRIACIGVATTKDISKGFTDHGIIIEWGDEAIDAFVFQDDDRKLYITWKAYGLTEGKEVEILASELSEDGLKLKGDYFSLTDRTRGWQGEAGEGQCLVKREGYYYLFYSVGGCCDNRCDYRIRVARSKDLNSGWEQYPEPVLQGGDVWRCTGHGTLVKTPDDRYFYLYHSYNLTDFEHIGRQGMLDEMFWDQENGWPYFNNGTPSESAITPFENTVQTRDSIWMDDFSSDQNLAFWEWDVNNPKPAYEVYGGEMIISAEHEGIGFLGLRPQAGAYSLTAEVIPADGWSGIGSYSNKENLLTLMVNQSEILLMQFNKGERKILSTIDTGEMGPVHLRYEVAAGRYFHFFWSENGVDWIPVQVGNEYTVDGTFIAQWGYSPRAGFLVEGGAGSIHHFSELRIEYDFAAAL